MKSNQNDYFLMEKLSKWGLFIKRSSTWRLFRWKRIRTKTFTSRRRQNDNIFVENTLRRKAVDMSIFSLKRRQNDDVFVEKALKWRFCGEKGTIQQEIKSDANDVIIVFKQGFITMYEFCHMIWLALQAWSTDFFHFYFNRLIRFI